MAELRSNEVLANIKNPGHVLCLLDKVCPQGDLLRRKLSHNIRSYISYSGSDSSYYHAYSGYIYIDSEIIDSIDRCTYYGSGWSFNGSIGPNNRIGLSGKGPKANEGDAPIEGLVNIFYDSAKFKDYVVSCSIPKLNNYMCSSIKCVCGDFILTNHDIFLIDNCTITLSTEDKSYSIDIKLDYLNQKITFLEDTQYDQSATNYSKINNKYFKTNPISLYLYIVPVYYM